MTRRVVPLSKPIRPAFPEGVADRTLCIGDAPDPPEINIDDVIASPWIGLHYRHELLLHYRHEELESPAQQGLR